jgi:hypothetical protein
MRFRHDLPYEASPAQVYSMLADPAFREAVCAAQEVVSVDARITPKSGGMQVTVDQVQRTPVPAFARRIIGATTRAVQREDWSDHRNAALVIETPGMPGTMSGTITIQPAGKQAVEVVELEIHSGVPLIGGRLEKLMADLVRKSIQTEHRTGIAWQAGDRP